MHNTRINVDPDFAEWAKLPSGCDGGNVAGAVWVCGYEWGRTEHPNDLDFGHQIAELKKGFPERPPAETERIVQNSDRRCVFDQRAFKLISVITTNRPLQGLKEVKSYARTHITYSARSEFFKLNLFPISFKNIKESNWRRGWANKTGLPTKKAYQDWCREHRYPEIAKWFIKGSPTLVIFTYEASMRDFFKIFGGSEIADWNAEWVEHRNLYWKLAKSGETVVAVFPTYSPYAKNKQIGSAGLRIREICDAQLGRDWLPRALQT